MAEGSSSTSSNKKWACAYCTYLNWEASAKCVLCYQSRDKPMLIEELCPAADDDATHSGILPDELATSINDVRWSCPTCTYQNCRHTKRCVQCRTDRPAAYMTPPNSGSSPKGANGTGHSIAQSSAQNLKESQQLISRALNKWTCQICTFDNWPTALKCTICGQSRAITREKSRSPPQQPQRKRKAQQDQPHLLETTSTTSFGHTSHSQFEINVPWKKKMKISEGETPQQQRSADDPQESSDNTDAGDLERLDQLAINGGALGKTEYANVLDIYTRRFLANDPMEKLFFKAASAIGHRDLQMVNRVVDYLINEGNLQRALTTFEARLMNQYIARSGTCRVAGFERADSLVYLAKKSDCMELVKLIRRVRSEEDSLPCMLNCAARTRLYAKITTQCMAVRDGPGAGQFKCQFIAEPHNFSILNMPMPGSELSLAIQNALFRPAPSIPPQLCYIDCYDAMANQGGLIVGRPPNFLLRNRGGSHSLYDAVFQSMFGVCDRFNILRAATKYTLHRSTNLFKLRWLEQQVRMIRECDLSVGAKELDANWDEIVNSVGEDDECTEPNFSIHICALAHVCCRPIIVCPMDEPVDVDELILPLGVGTTPGGPHSPSTRGTPRQTSTNAAEQQEGTNQQQPEKPFLRQTNNHSYEGIYLPILWAPRTPVSRSPLILTYRNGQFNAVLISDGNYQRDAEVQRYVRIRRSLRRPVTASDSLFRFLSRPELDNSALLAQFILFGHCTAHQLSIRREPHSYLHESLLLYRNWMQAMLQMSTEQNISCGAATNTQLENRMDNILMGNGKKRKGANGGCSPPVLQQHQQTLMTQLFSPTANQQLQQQGSRQQQFMTHSGSRSSPVEDTPNDEDRPIAGDDNADDQQGLFR